MRKVASSLHVSVSSIQMLCKKHFPNVKFSIGGKSQKLTYRMEMSCIRNLTEEVVK